MFALRRQDEADVLGDILTALTRYEIVVGALVACGMIGGFVLLNKWRGWWVSSDLVSAEKARASEAKSEAEATVAATKAAMDTRVRELREDAAVRVAQVRSDSQAELDRLLKLIDALQREIESWRQAYHLEAAGNDAEESARWTRIEAMLVVVQRFVTEVQRHAPRALDPGNDGAGGQHVV